MQYTYDAGGNVTHINDVTRLEQTAYAYDALDRVTWAATSYSGSPLFKRSYSYDAVGNIMSVGRWPNPPAADHNYGSIGGASLEESSGTRGRVTGFTGITSSAGTLMGGSAAAFTVGSLGTGSAGTVTYLANSVASGAVAANGIRNSVTAFSGGTARLAFTQGSSAPAPVPEQAWAYTGYTYSTQHPHQATALSTGERYTYDGNGNMTERIEGGVTYTQTFDAQNRLSTVTTITGTTRFEYDGDGNLVKTTRPDNSVTIYVGGIYEKLTLGDTTTTTTYYNALTARVMRVERDSASQVYYILTDQLGSASVALNSEGNVVGEMRYYAFGETRLATGNMMTDKLYTGQRDVGIGLYNFNARFYDPYLKRFISADAIVPRVGDSQALNRYSYVYNSPCNYRDPSGHSPCEDPGWEQAFKDAHGGAAPTDQDRKDCQYADEHPGSGANGEWTQEDWEKYTWTYKPLVVIIARLGQSAIGHELLDLAMAGPGFEATFSYDNGAGMNPWGNTVLTTSLKPGVDTAAAALAHELTHVLQRYHRYGAMATPLMTTVESEREAYLIEFGVDSELGIPVDKGSMIKLTYSWSASKDYLWDSFPDWKSQLWYVDLGSHLSGQGEDWQRNLRGLGFSQTTIDTIRRLGAPVISPIRTVNP